MTVTYQHSTTLMNKVSHLAYHGKLSFWILILKFILDIKCKIEYDSERFIVHPGYM